MLIARSRSREFAAQYARRRFPGGKPPVDAGNIHIASEAVRDLRIANVDGNDLAGPAVAALLENPARARESLAEEIRRRRPELCVMVREGRPLLCRRVEYFRDEPFSSAARADPGFKDGGGSGGV